MRKGEELHCLHGLRCREGACNGGIYRSHIHLYPKDQTRRFIPNAGRLRLKCDGTRAETRFRLSAKRTSPFKSAGASVQSTNGSVVMLVVMVDTLSEVVMLDTLSSEVVWRVLVTHSIRQFPLHFPSCASPCTITFQLGSNILECEAVNTKIVAFRNVRRLLWRL